MIDAVVAYSKDTFGFRLANELGVQYADFKTQYHPDGEPHPKVDADYDQFRGKRVLLVSRRDQLPNRNKVVRHLHNLSRVTHTLTHNDLYGAEVDVLMPYFLLGRQDHNPRTDEDPEVRDRDRGEGLGYRYVTSMFKGMGAQRMITFNPHFYRKEEDRELDIDGFPVQCLSATPTIAEYAKPRISDDAVIIGPDGSASDMVQKFAALVGRNVMVFEKHRQDGDNVVFGDRQDLQGRDVVLVDDILSTLGTMVGAAKTIKNRGTLDIYAVHPVLPEVGYERALGVTRDPDFVRRIYGTDTIDSEFSGDISVIPKLKEFLSD